MKIRDDIGFKAQITVFSDGEDITEEFFKEFTESKWMDTLNVNDGIACIMKVMSFINRINEFSGIEVNPEDRVVINFRCFRCITDDAKNKIG